MNEEHIEINITITLPEEYKFNKVSRDIVIQGKYVKGTVKQMLDEGFEMAKAETLASLINGVKK